MRTFAPLAEGDLPVPGELLDSLVDSLGPPGPWLLIGATARDVALILGGVTLPRRATNVVPFGDLERDGEVVIHGSSLSVLGCAEAAANADLVTLPSGRLLPVAPLELMAVLKLIAFTGRQPAETKDADDLLTVLRAASEGTYGEETWDDELAMAATDYDHELAGAYRLGSRGSACFSPERAQRVLQMAAEIPSLAGRPRRTPGGMAGRHPGNLTTACGSADGSRPRRRAARLRQKTERLAAGSRLVDSGFLFTTEVRRGVRPPERAEGTN